LGGEVPRARRWRTVLLELERIYNHVMDAGAILAHTGFPVGQAHCLRLRERLLRMNKTLTGHRLLRGAIVPGGLAFEPRGGRDLLPVLRETTSDFAEMMELRARTRWCDRPDDTGRLPGVARDFGVVGYVARASGLRAMSARITCSRHAVWDSSRLSRPAATSTPGCRCGSGKSGVVDPSSARLRLLAGSHIRVAVGAARPSDWLRVVEAARRRLAHGDRVREWPAARVRSSTRRSSTGPPWPEPSRTTSFRLSSDQQNPNQSYSGNDL
jgi:hypothetical protein